MPRFTIGYVSLVGFALMAPISTLFAPLGAKLAHALPKRSLEIADQVPLAYVVLHLGNPREQFSPMSFEYAYGAIALIRSFCGAEVMIENIPNEVSTLEGLLGKP